MTEPASRPTAPPAPPNDLVGITVPDGYHGPPPITLDRPHFVRSIEGEPDVCGQCGQPWECDSSRAQREEAAGGRDYPGGATPVALAAAMAGLSVEDYQNRMAAFLASMPKL